MFHPIKVRHQCNPQSSSHVAQSPLLKQICTFPALLQAGCGSCILSRADRNGGGVKVRIIGKPHILFPSFPCQSLENITLNVEGLLLLDSKQLIKMDNVGRNMDFVCISLALPSCYGPDWRNEKGSSSLSRGKSSFWPLH